MRKKDNVPDEQSEPVVTSETSEQPEQAIPSSATGPSGTGQEVQEVEAQRPQGDTGERDMYGNPIPEGSAKDQPAETEFTG